MKRPGERRKRYKTLLGERLSAQVSGYADAMPVFPELALLRVCCGHHHAPGEIGFPVGKHRQALHLRLGYVRHPAGWFVNRLCVHACMLVCLCGGGCNWVCGWLQSVFVPCVVVRCGICVCTCVYVHVFVCMYACACRVCACSCEYANAWGL